jgi:2-polyprenyl-3-methyl-5-hydroxy-6-metoxy-1,4-benzoquinol methylase
MVCHGGRRLQRGSVIDPPHLNDKRMSAISSDIERFNRLSTTCWDSRGPIRPLRVVNALRLNYVVKQVASHTAHHN